MNHAPPSGIGGSNDIVRQPLATYLGSSVRPSVAPPASSSLAPPSPLPVVPSPSSLPSSHARILASYSPSSITVDNAGLFSSSATLARPTNSLFSTESTSHSSDIFAAQPRDHLSSLLHTSPRAGASESDGGRGINESATTTTGSTSYGIVNASSSSSSSSLSVPNNARQLSNPQQSFTNPLAIPSRLSMPLPSVSPSSSPPKGSPLPAPSGSPLHPLSSPSPSSNLEQVVHHPLTGRASTSSRPPLPTSSPSASPGAGAGRNTNLGGPFDINASANNASAKPNSFNFQQTNSALSSNSGVFTVPQSPSSTILTFPPASFAPAPLAPTSSEPSAPPMSVCASAPPTHPAPAPAPGDSPPFPESPDDGKLSTLLRALFLGSPPPARLASFDPREVQVGQVNEQGLGRLAAHGCWRELVRMVERMLPANSGAVDPTVQSTPPHVMYRYVHLYVAALMKLRKYDLASAVIQQRVGNIFAADKLYSSHPSFYSSPLALQESSKFVGNMIPFELHVLITQLPHQHQGKTRFALDQMMKLLHMVRLQWQRKVKEEESGSKHTTNGNSANHATTSDGALPTTAAAVPAHNNPLTLHSPHTLSPLSSSALHHHLCSIRLHIVNMCLSFNNPSDIDYDQAQSWLEDVIDDNPNDVTLIESMIRLQMQMGDARRAEEYMQQSAQMYHTIWSSSSSTPFDPSQHIPLSLQRVLLSLSRNDYVGAYGIISALYAIHPYNMDVCNNYAVCCLYVNKITDGIQAMEALIRHDPIGHMHISVLSNLRALYDLSSTNPALKRRMIEGLVLQYGADDLELSN